MRTQRNYYEILGVSPDATLAQIKAKYRDLARQFHPDLVTDKQFGQKVFMQVNLAYRTLRDPIRRAEYDEALARSLTEENERVAHWELIQQMESNLRMADVALMNGDAVTARRLSETIVSTHPRRAEAHRILGDALVLLRERDKAIASYQSFLEIMPSLVVEAKLRQLEAANAGVECGIRTPIDDSKRWPFLRFLHRAPVKPGERGG